MIYYIILWHATKNYTPDQYRVMQLVYRFGPMFGYYGGVIRTEEVRFRDL